MEKTLPIKISLIIQLFASGYLLVFGIIYMISGQFQFYHATFVDMTWGELGDYNAELQFLFSTIIRLLGLMDICLGILLLGLLYLIYWKDDKIAFIAATVSGMLFIVVFNILTAPILGTQALVIFVIDVAFIGLLAMSYGLAGRELFKTS